MYKVYGQLHVHFDQMHTCLYPLYIPKLLVQLVFTLETKGIIYKLLYGLHKGKVLEGALATTLIHIVIHAPHQLMKCAPHNFF